MRRLRVWCCLLFVLSCILFGLYAVKNIVFNDGKAPEISCDEEVITVSVKEDMDTALLKGVTAKDNRDGDISDAVRVASLSHFAGNERTVTYVVFDKANNVATLQRKVKYSDYIPPRIYSDAPFRYELNEMNTSDVLNNMTAEDCLEGDLSNDIKMSVEGGSYIGSAGEYLITFQVSNGARDVCIVSVAADVVDSFDESEKGKEYPVLSDYILYTSVGKSVNLEETIVGAEVGGREYSMDEYVALYGEGGVYIEMDSDVDYNTPGVYEVRYWSSAGKKAVTKQYVVVEGE